MLPVHASPGQQLLAKHEKPAPPRRDVERWLQGHHGCRIDVLEPLEGGFWSTAWAYEAAGDALVCRLARSREGFDIDARAHALAGSALPVPQVLFVGEALGFEAAISQRHHGVVLETRPAAEAPRVTALLAQLLAGLRAVPIDADLPANWCEAPEDRLGWRDWLRRGYRDIPGAATAGWMERLAEHPQAKAVFDACVERIEALLPLCPERRDLVHGDLLHQNVLVAPDCSAVTAVFSWKCSVLGDFLYDLAWCTHWSPWFECIDADAVLAAALADPTLTAAERVDAPARHQCYELHIAAVHFAWFVWTQDEENLARLVESTRGILARELPDA